jgi:phytanoyl-CoA hydroxylase
MTYRGLVRGRLLQAFCPKGIGRQTDKLGRQNFWGIRRTLLRNNTPGNDAIGVYYNKVFLRHGEDTAVTAGVPVGDVSEQDGGQIYLGNSHTIGAEIEDTFTRKARALGTSEAKGKSAFNQNMMGGGSLAAGPAAFEEH